MSDDLANETRNQHFLTRAEQRLNSLNPNASPENMRVYSFRVTDRARFQVALENTTGRSIGKNLSYLDLYSFDVPGGEEFRLNFETLFGRYEQSVVRNTQSLLAKLQSGQRDVKAEIIDVFASKFLNFVRNPYSVQKVINSLPKLATYQPTDSKFLALYNRIIEGRKPHQAHLCKILGISDITYLTWLRTLFMLLYQPAGFPNMFEGLIKGLIESSNTYANAYVFAYDTDCCLLSDRGYSQPIAGDDHLSFSFNLTAHAFVTYVFMDINVATKDFPRERVEMGRESLSKGFEIKYARNDLHMLGIYNMRCIEQCHERVFCAAKEFVLPQGFTNEAQA